MKKRILLTIMAVAAIAFGVVGMSAYEAHVINVTAKIENALAVNTYGIDFGTVFPQENITNRTFDISLSNSFQTAGNRVDSVAYKLVQKPKPWTLNFGEPADVSTHNRSLLFVDPDQGKGEGYSTSGGLLTITTGNDVEDLFGQNEVAADWTAPRMVIPMGGDFTIETKVTANPMAYPGTGATYQSGGILVYASNGNIIRLELANFSGLGSTAVYMESQVGSAKMGKGWNSLSSATTVYLRLTRTGDLFKGEYSADGTTWNPVTLQEGTFTNASIGGLPQVGLTVTDNNANQDNLSFLAQFDYVTFNGGYQDLCKFLSKTSDGGSFDISEPSYFIGYGEGQGQGCATPATTASGVLSKGIDPSDIWTVDFKVPPIAGYIGQEWPTSCASYVVPTNGVDYGCDIWVEVTNIGLD